MLSRRTFLTDEAASFGSCIAFVPDGQALTATPEYGADLSYRLT